MSAPLINTISMLIGARGKGKTPFVIGDEKVPIEGLVETYLDKNMKVLFLDTINHPSYSNFKRIEIDQFAKWKKGVYRYWCSPFEMEKNLRLITPNLWNTLVVVEDAYKHQKNKLTPSMVNLIGDSKQQNDDMIFMYHTWKFVPLDLYAYLDYMEIFKTNRLPGKREEAELADHFEAVLEVAKRVNAHPDNYYHESIEITQ